MYRKILFRFIIFTGVVILAWIASCATSPLGRSQLSFVSAGQLNQMGVKAFDALKQETPQERDPAINRYVRCVADNIIRENRVAGQWEVVVFQDDDANAFALPGGKIGVHTGLFKAAVNQHQLATVIGHEIAHVLANHSGERVSQETALQTGLDLVKALGNVQSQTGQTILGLLGVGAQFGILMPYSRLQESEADLYGLDLMARGGFDPRESINLWVNMSKLSGGAEPPAFLSTHPSHATRIQDLQSRMNIAMQLSQQAGKGANCGK